MKIQDVEMHEFAETNEKLNILRSDNGEEYLSNELKVYMADHGIKHQLTVSYTPHQNGVAQRMK